MPVTKPVTKLGRCRYCGAVIQQPATGRARQFCSDTHRQRAHQRRRAGIQAVYHRRQSDEWATPRDRWAEWNAEFGFTLDAAATADNALCDRFFTIEEDLSLIHI